MIDIVEINTRGGDGGDGVVSFRREKFVPFGGPDGGDGGVGGSVVVMADAAITDLRLIKHKRYYRASNGKSGKGKKVGGLIIHYTYDPKLSLIILGNARFISGGGIGHTMKEEIIKIHTIKESLGYYKDVNLNFDLLEGVKAENLFQILWKNIKGRVTIYFFKISLDIYRKIRAMK